MLLTHIAMSHELQSGTKRTAAPDLPYAQPMRPAPAVDLDGDGRRDALVKLVLTGLPACGSNPRLASGPAANRSATHAFGAACRDSRAQSRRRRRERRGAGPGGPFRGSRAAAAAWRAAKGGRL